MKHFYKEYKLFSNISIDAEKTLKFACEYGHLNIVKWILQV